MRSRFFKEETAKIRPPIEVSRVHIIRAPTSLGNPEEIGNIDRTDAGGAQEPTPPLVGFQGTTVLRDLEFTASPNPNPPKRAANSTNDIPSTSTVNHFIRRQHRKLLGKIPVLTYFEHPNSQVGKYQVSLLALANSDSSNRLTLTVPMADEIDLAWLMLPAPPQEPRVDVGFPLSQEPKGNVELAMDTMQMVDQNPQITRKLEPEALPRPQQFNWMDGDDSPDELQHRSKGGSPGSKAEPKAKVVSSPKRRGSQTLKFVRNRHTTQLINSSIVREADPGGTLLILGTRRGRGVLTKRLAKRGFPSHPSPPTPKSRKVWPRNGLATLVQSRNGGNQGS